MAKTGTLRSEHWTNDAGAPTGGVTQATGLMISWQNGPLGTGAERKPPNGAFVEDVIEAARDRIRHYQTANDGKFACADNGIAMHHLSEALRALENRTARRESLGIEGTHAPCSQSAPLETVPTPEAT